MATIPCTNPRCKSGRIYRTREDLLTEKEVTTSIQCPTCAGSGVIKTKENQ